MKFPSNYFARKLAVQNARPTLEYLHFVHAVAAEQSETHTHDEINPAGTSLHALVFPGYDEWPQLLAHPPKSVCLRRYAPLHFLLKRAAALLASPKAYHRSRR